MHFKSFSETDIYVHEQDATGYKTYYRVRLPVCQGLFIVAIVNKLGNFKSRFSTENHKLSGILRAVCLAPTSK